MLIDTICITTAGVRFKINVWKNNVTVKHTMIYPIRDRALLLEGADDCTPNMFLFYRCLVSINRLLNGECLKETPLIKEGGKNTRRTFLKLKTFKLTLFFISKLR